MSMEKKVAGEMESVIIELFIGDFLICSQPLTLNPKSYRDHKIAGASVA